MQTAAFPRPAPPAPTARGDDDMTARSRPGGIAAIAITP